MACKNVVDHASGADRIRAMRGGTSTKRGARGAIHRMFNHPIMRFAHAGHAIGGSGMKFLVRGDPLVSPLILIIGRLSSASSR
jgi:hypothetical protein